MLRALLVVALVALAGQASASWFDVGTTPNKFIVTYSGVPSFEKFGFYTMPRNWEEAGKLGFFQVQSRLYVDRTEVWCRMNDFRVCVLFDRRGSAAGIQLSLTVEEFEASGVPKEVVEAPEWRRNNLLNHDVYSATAFFVDKETLMNDGRGDLWGDKGLTAPKGIYILQSDAHGNETGRLHVSTDQAMATASGFNEQSCFWGMGKHYFQETYKEAKCEAHRPYFLLFNHKTSKLHGFGFTMYGKGSFQGTRKWFESPPAAVAKMIAPNSPDCMTDWINKYGLFTLHVYFVERPWFSGC